MDVATVTITAPRVPTLSILCMSGRNRLFGRRARGEGGSNGPNNMPFYSVATKSSSSSGTLTTTTNWL